MLGWLRTSSAASVPDGQRVYAVGDLHGRRDLLDELAEMIRLDDLQRGPAETTLILLGDLIDRGPASRAVVERVMQGFDWARTISLMGNHEAVMLDVVEGRREKLPSWMSFGGRETLLSWGVPKQMLDEGTQDEIVSALRSTLTAAERGWLSRLRSHVQIGGYYFVHAGIRPGVPLNRQEDEDRLWIRDEFLDSRRKHGAVIVHGHSIMPEVEHMPNRIGLDTGAYESGRLTALGLEGRDRWFLSTEPAEG